MIIVPNQSNSFSESVFHRGVLYPFSLYFLSLYFDKNANSGDKRWAYALSYTRLVWRLMEFAFLGVDFGQRLF